MRLLFIFFAVTVLSGCYSTSTTPIATNEATFIAHNQWITRQYREPSTNTGVLLIQRDTGLFGSACRMYIKLNGEAVAFINGGEKLELNLKPGRFLLQAETGDDCRVLTVKTEVEINTAQTTIYRLGIVNHVLSLIHTIEY